MIHLLMWSAVGAVVSPSMVLALAPGDCTGSNGTAQCLIQVYVNPFIALLSALVGVATVASVVYGTILYIQSGGDPGKAAAAKKKITNAIIGLVAFLLLLVFLQFLLPVKFG